MTKEKPTVKQINFLHDLIERWALNYDLLEIQRTWSKQEVGELISSIVEKHSEDY